MAFKRNNKNVRIIDDSRFGRISQLCDILNLEYEVIKINVISPRKSGPYLSFKGDIVLDLGYYNDTNYHGFKSFVCVKVSKPIPPDYTKYLLYTN